MSVTVVLRLSRQGFGDLPGLQSQTVFAPAVPGEAAQMAPAAIAISAAKRTFPAIPSGRIRLLFLVP